MTDITNEVEALWAEVQAVGREYGCADRHELPAEPSESNKKVLERYVRAVLKAHDHWVPGRWWRVLDKDGKVWCESSSEQENRRAMRPGDRLQRTYVATEHGEWRDVE